MRTPTKLKSAHCRRGSQRCLYRRTAFCAHPCCADAADRLHAYLAGHADRGVVAAGLRQGARPLRLHQHADRGAHRDLRSKYDVIIFAPVGRVSTQQVINGMPMWGNPLPWEKTDLTPNLGRVDSTPDMRPGADVRRGRSPEGLHHQGRPLHHLGRHSAVCHRAWALRRESSSRRDGNVRVVGSVLAAVFVDKSSPVANGYGTDLAVYSADGMAFTVGQYRRQPAYSDGEGFQATDRARGAGG